MKKINLKIIIFLFILFSLFGTILFLFSKKEGKNLVIEGEENTLLKPKKKIITPSPFSGLDCKNYKNRAFGVILAQYPETMPLSGISQADIVIEWPVANAGGVTRLLAIFQCQNPKEIGSIRSARPYIADIAKGFDLIFASWGGPDILYQEVKKINLDWLNGMENPSGVFFRKISKPSPHNGFASFDGLKKAALDKKMRMENNFEGYQFLKEEEIVYRDNEHIINLPYNPPVKFVYDKNTGNYFRYWDNIETVDFNNNKKVYAKNVVLLKTNIGVLREGVARADIIGSGEAIIYRGGEEIVGSWRKNSPQEKLFFLDSSGQEIKFIPGPIWIEIVNRF